MSLMPSVTERVERKVRHDNRGPYISAYHAKYRPSSPCSKQAQSLVVYVRIPGVRFGQIVAITAPPRAIVSTLINPRMEEFWEKEIEPIKKS